MIEKSKHILFVTSEFPPQPGGIGNHAYNIAKQLLENNYAVQVITDQRSVSGEEEKGFDAMLNYKVHRVHITKIRFLMYVKRLILLFDTIKSVDKVIASGKFSLWIVAFVSVFYKKKYIAVIHGSEVNFSNTYLKTITNKSLKRFSKIIAVSNYTKGLVENVCSNVVVIPNGINAENLNKTPLKNKTLIGYPKLITVGNVSERKGQLQVIKHLPELIKYYPEIHYHCIGLPTQKEQFSQIAKELNVLNYITFHGRATDQELKSCLKESDIFVMLSGLTKTGDVEGFGIALIEANYMGLPCIGATGCGIEDAIKNNYSGKLIEPSNAKAFITAIQDIIANYEAYKKNAKKWSMQHEWNSIVKQYIKEIEY
ncbi:glycosyltransferase family 4 protein [Lacinutrix gracilariae]|uniref:Glycosyltransferase family 4 protein n=1 Tax=Lacinutrix gracilariae TaxID=1747198 RepID=A0ABW5K2B5_9FLAO